MIYPRFQLEQRRVVHGKRVIGLKQYKDGNGGMVIRSQVPDMQTNFCFHER